MKIQLLYFDGCPNVEPARAALREALGAEGLDEPIDEIDLQAADAPAWARGWGSPTIMIDGAELTGAQRSDGSSCRLYPGGAPSVAQIRRRLTSARRAGAPASGRAVLPLVGAVGAAVAASACCVLPPVLAIAGLSGAGFAAALAPYRPYFLLATAVALGIGFWLVHRKRPDACGCEAPRARRSARVALWIATVATVAVAAYPWLGGDRATAGSRETAAVASLRLRVSGMDCPPCTRGIAKRLKQIPGVASAAVDFDSGIAIVRHDGREGIDGAALAAVEQAGFTAKVVR